MKLIDSVHRRFVAALETMFRLVHPPPAGCEDGRYSMILPMHEDAVSSHPSSALLDISLAAIEHARTVNLDDIGSRMRAGPRWPEYWPGEHYKLLAGLVIALRPRTVIEVGTFTGLSALALKKFLPEDGVLTTFDITEWNAFSQTCLNESDFDNGQLIQRIADLSDAQEMKKHQELLQMADLIFVDAPKDGVFEPRFLQNLEEVEFHKPPLVVFDDIRLWKMLAVWRGITRPKLDLTSFGHWSGTGLVLWERRSRH